MCDRAALTRTEAEPALVSSVDELVTLVPVDVGDQRRQGIGNQVEPALALDQGRFGPSTTVPVNQQAHDQQRLDAQECRRRDHVPTVLLPQCRRTEKDRASRWEEALADAPALELPPVIHRRHEPHRRLRATGRRLALEDADGHRPSRDAQRPVHAESPSDGPGT